jgi:hypothetical protein
MTSRPPRPFLRLSRYVGSLRQEYVDQAFPADGRLEFAFADARWSARLHALPHTGHADRADRAGIATDYELHLQVLSGEPRAVAAALVWTIDDWSLDHHLLLPGAVYAGNRFETRRIGYPPIVTAPADLGPDAPLVIADVPRLALASDPGASRLNLLTADLTTPAVGIHFPTTNEGWWIATDQGTRLGNTGLDFEENSDRTRATLALSAPGMREDAVYFIGTMAVRKSPDRAPDWAVGATVVLRASVHAFPCTDVAALYVRLADVRPAMPVIAPAVLPFSAAFDILREKFNRENWHEASGIYAGTTEQHADGPTWQMGWVGGMQATLPLLALGDSATRARVLRNLDFVFAEGLSRSGFFEGMLERGRWTDDSFGKAPDPSKRWHLTRKSADGLYFILRHFAWLDLHAPGSVKPDWEAGVIGCAEAFVRLWKRHRQLGQFIDLETGDILVGGSTSAGMAPAGLALAARYFDRPEWLDVAGEIAAYFHREYVSRGLSCGGPGEALQSFDSESAIGLVESFTTLHELTGEPRWLAIAEESAALAATWVMSYDYRFPVASSFGALDMRTAGTVFANVQNKHSAPGFCTLSGDALLRLFRLTGERRHLDLARQVARALPQFVSRPGRTLAAQGGFMHPGWINERVNTSDWLEPVGEIFAGSCWCESSLLLTVLDFPGIYAQPDTGLVACFDHVEAAWLPGSAAGESEDSPILEIRNPTEFPAAVVVFTETAAAMRQPWSANWRARTKIVLIPARCSCRHPAFRTPQPDRYQKDAALIIG